MVEVEEQNMKLSAVLAAVFVWSCAGSPARSDAPTPEPVEASGVTEPREPAPTAGGRVLEISPATPHGTCCTSDGNCGEITCRPSEYPIEGCERVCTLSCEPSDTCPAIGGSLDPPAPCPESGFCPVGAPYV